jgi:hypothetical protein
LPNLQVLERQPIRRAVPGSIGQREFEYKRQGIVHMLVFLVVRTGRMVAECVEVKDAGRYVEALRRFRRRHRHLNGAYLIHDDDGSHVAGETQNCFNNFRHWRRVSPTPPHASWLNQADLPRDAFELR